jgi:hypothetical protein
VGVRQSQTWACWGICPRHEAAQKQSCGSAQRFRKEA